MKKRVQTLDEFINEQMINESKLFYRDIYDNFELVYVFTDPEKKQ